MPQTRPPDCSFCRRNRVASAEPSAKCRQVWASVARVSWFGGAHVVLSTLIHRYRLRLASNLSRHPVTSVSKTVSLELRAPSIGKSGQVWRASVGLAVHMLSSRPSFTTTASDLPQTCRGIPSHLAIGIFRDAAGFSQLHHAPARRCRQSLGWFRASLRLCATRARH